MKKYFKRGFNFVKKHKLGFALGAILLIAAFFRLWKLGSLPPGLHPDEAANGLDIFRMQEGDWRVLYNTNGPREALFFYLQGIFVYILGNTILALRLAPALIGIASVGATYLWVKEWFSHRTALVAAAFTATGVWAVTINRDGYRAGMMTLMIPLVGWLFALSYKKRKWYLYVLTGFVTGLGFYTYLSYRFMIVIGFVLLIYALIFYRQQLKEFVKPLIIMTLVSALTLAPLGLYAIKNPDDVLGGRSSVSITNPELNKGNLPKTFAENIYKTALMFNIKGDGNYRHNLGGAPMLNAFVGILFLLGLLISLRRIKDIRYFALLVAFGCMLLPEILTAEGIPHALRAIGVVPIVYVLAAIGFSELLSRWRGVFPNNLAARAAGLIILLGLLGFSALYDYNRYFVAWANNERTYEAYSEDAVAIGNYLRNSPYSGERIAIIDGYSNLNVLYLNHGRAAYIRADAKEITKLANNKPQQFVVVARENKVAAPILNQLGAKLIKRFESPARKGVTLYYVYELNGAKQ